MHLLPVESPLLISRSLWTDDSGTEAKGEELESGVVLEFASQEFSLFPSVK